MCIRDRVSTQSTGDLVPAMSRSWCLLMLVWMAVLGADAIKCNVFNQNNGANEYRRVDYTGSPSIQNCVTLSCTNRATNTITTAGAGHTKTYCEIGKVTTDKRCTVTSCCTEDHCNSPPAGAEDRTPANTMWERHYH
eukprot:TRINITY_DN3265_c0_g1_i5.p1 TRINITY_DN3265_c0_g1~~TRINITY_DN3265_c0_g1_i5.p1  ORF type:complete len:137 (+),score=32.96 TRINITY_DN3265_c0_g1_i5:116-526(+)